MSTLSVFNQTITELLPPRTVEPRTTKPSEGFDNELKNADARLDKPRSAEDAPRSTPVDEKPEVKEPSAEVTEKPAADKQEQPVAEAEATTDEPTQATEPVETTEPADETVTDTATAEEGQATPVLTEAAATVITNAQLLEQVQETAQAVAQATQAAVAEAPAVEVQTEQPTTVNTKLAAQQVAAPVVTEATVNKALVEQATTPVITTAQPQQTKAENTQQAQNTNQGEASATAERIEIVSESRQQDSRQATADDAGRQLQAEFKGDGKTQAATTTQAFNTNTSTTTTTADAATAVRTFTAVDGPVQNAGPAAPSGPAPQTQTTDNTQLNTARIARGIQNAIQQKGGSITLRLTPPEMGTVRIQLQIQNGAVNAQFHAETESTRTMLNQQISQLRTALESQGLGVERLGVHTMQSSSNTSMQQDAQSDRDGQPNDGRSRGGFTQQGGRQGQPSDTEQQQAFEQELNDAA